MPRHSKSVPPGKGSSRSEGGHSGKGNARGKSYKGSGKGNPRSSSSGRAYGNKTNAAGSSRGPGRSKPGARPYNKRSENASPRATSPKRYERPSTDSENKGFGKKSRFAKPARGTSFGTEKFGTEKSREDSSASRRPASRAPRGSSGRPRAKSGGSFPRTDGDDRRKERGASYGKPYKKTYRPASEGARTGGIRKRTPVTSDPKSDKVRLNKFISNSGISSRREADELIKMGLISVNGQIVSALGYKVNPGDEVRYEDKVLRAEKPVYILMNKPKGFLTTTEDPQDRKTVMHILGSAVKERVYPVGRLDRNTTGLLLLTNDGDLADKLMHPSFNVRKVYKVELDRALTKGDFQSIAEGVRLEEGRAQVDDVAIVSENGRTVGIELHIGWNRVVRRIFESLGYEVVKLDRTVYAGLDKKELSRGQWRFLTKEEIIHLKHFK